MEKMDISDSTVASVACPNCGAALERAYCADCGQPHIEPDDLGLGHALRHLFHEITHLDGKLWGTLLLLFRRPGQLTLDYAERRRKCHVHPIRLFLLASACYYFIGVQASYSLRTMVEVSPQKTKLFTRVAEKRGQSLTEFVNQVETSFQHWMKTFTIASVVFIGFGLWLLFRKRDRRIVFHQLVALHLTAFAFLINVVLFPLWWLVRSAVLFSVVTLLVTSVYNAFAFRRVYRSSWFSTVGKMFLLLLVDVVLENLVLWFAVGITVMRKSH